MKRLLGLILFVFLVSVLVVSACENNICAELGDHDDKYTPGAVIWNVSGTGDPTHKDRCIASNTKLKEYYCINSTTPPAHTIYTCTCITDPQTGWGYCQNNEVPEFSGIAAGIALAGAGAGFIFLRRKK